MVAENNLHTIRLFDLLAMDGGEKFFESVANSFVSKNSDVEQFFREKSVQATKLNTAAVLQGFCPLGENITVKVRGGELIVNYTGETVYLTGAATLSYEGVIEI
jgi:hypothetical protein